MTFFQTSPFPSTQFPPSYPYRSQTSPSYPCSGTCHSATCGSQSCTPGVSNTVPSSPDQGLGHCHAGCLRQFPASPCPSLGHSHPGFNLNV